MLLQKAEFEGRGAVPKAVTSVGELVGDASWSVRTERLFSMSPQSPRHNVEGDKITGDDLASAGNCHQD